ECN
ncbi:hypothetical protein ECEC1865_4225, partial [Escherichia coli EC1865]